jgi:hypothetical protein
MAFNPSPKVAAARDYGRKFKQDVVIITTFSEGFSRYEIVSYGEDKKRCAQAKIIAEELEKAVQELEL